MPINLLTENQAKKLKKLGINSTIDVILYLPNRYSDQTSIHKIQNLKIGEISQIQVTVNEVEVRYRPKKNLILYVSDETGEMQIRFLHYYPSQIKQFESLDMVRFYGEVRYQSGYIEMIHPEYSQVSVTTPLPKNLTPNFLRGFVILLISL